MTDSATQSGFAPRSPVEIVAACIQENIIEDFEPGNPSFEDDCHELAEKIVAALRNAGRLVGVE